MDGFDFCIPLPGADYKQRPLRQSPYGLALGASTACKRSTRPKVSPKEIIRMERPSRTTTGTGASSLSLLQKVPVPHPRARARCALCVVSLQMRSLMNPGLHEGRSGCDTRGRQERMLEALPPSAIGASFYQDHEWGSDKPAFQNCHALTTRSGKRCSRQPLLTERRTSWSRNESLWAINRSEQTSSSVTTTPSADTPSSLTTNQAAFSSQAAISREPSVWP